MGVREGLSEDHVKLLSSGMCNGAGQCFKIDDKLGDAGETDFDLSKPFV